MMTKCPVNPKQALKDIEKAKKHIDEQLKKSDVLISKLTERFRNPKKSAKPYISGEDALKYMERQIVSSEDIPRDDPLVRKLGKVKALLFKLKTQLVDKYVGIEMFSPKAYRMTRLNAGIQGKIDTFLNTGTFEYENATKITGKSLSSILEPVVKNPGDQKIFDSYLLAKRAQSLEARNAKTGENIQTQITAELAKKIISESETPERKQAAQELQSYQDSVLRYLVDTEVLSEKSYKSIKDKNEFYVPYYRMVEGKAQDVLNRPGSNIYDPTKALKGGDYAFLSPTESIIKNTQLFLQLGDQNSIRKALVTDMIANEQTREVFEQFKEKYEGQEDLIEEAKQLTGLDQDFAFKDADISLLQAAFQDAVFLNRDNVMNVRIKGESKLFMVDPILNEAFKSMQRKELGVAMKMMQKTASVLRTGATLPPDFIIRSTLRDIPEALMKTQYGISLVDIIEGFSEAVKQGEVYQQWKVSGGSQFSPRSMTRKQLVNSLNKLGVNWKSLKNIVVDKKLGLEAVAHALEAGPRLAEFKKGLMKEGVTEPQLEELRRKGASQEEIVEKRREGYEKAALSSRNITIDFARSGYKLQAINRVIPFSNAFAQGFATFFENFNPRVIDGKVSYKNTLLPIYRTILYSVLPSMALAAINSKEKWFQDIPQYQKDMFWLAKFGDTIYRYPKPHEFSLIGNMGERFTEYLIRKDPEVFNDYLKQLLGTVETRMLIPTFLVPIIEGYTNRDIFHNRALVPVDAQRNIVKHRYGVYTSELSKKLAEIVASISGDEEGRFSTFRTPIFFDHLINRWTGSLGRLALDAADKIAQTSGLVEEVVVPEKKLTELPIIRGFFVNYPAQNAKSITQFYDRYEYLQQLKASAARMKKEGRISEYHALTKKLNGEIKQDKTYQAMRNAYATLRKIYKSRTLTAKEKANIRDNVVLQMVQMATLANERAKSSNR